MADNYKISKMSKDELSIAIAWMREESWNPGLNDAECFYSADPNGFLVGKLDNEIISVASAVAYDEHYAFFGCYIVKPEYRGLGYGMALTNAKLNYVGDRITGLDGVVAMTDEYKKIGYQPAHNNIRYALNSTISNVPNKNIITIDETIFDKIQNYDRNYFPAARKNFLTCWLKPYSGKALAYVSHNTIEGYAVIRKCFQGYKIGPLFAETPEIAEALFLQLVNNLSELPIFLDIPKPNGHAIKLVEKYQMNPVFETIRMYRCGTPNINLDHIYGITTFELG